MQKRTLKPQIKTLLAILWFAFTFALVTWWWVFFLKKLAPLESSYRMFAWEGSILLASIIFGGISLILFSYRDQQRHERLRFFFATFSHDIKTSITRLRLQAEVLEEDLGSTNNPIMKRLIGDIQRLDLQLENALLLSTLENGSILKEEVPFSDLISNLRNEFPELTIEISHDACLLGDRRALLSIFKNMFQNSVLHGKATAVKISIRKGTQEEIELLVEDNGLGFKGPLDKLGSEILVSKNTQSNGIGLLITSRLIQKMKGEVRFQSQENAGFQVVIKMKGHLK